MKKLLSKIVLNRIRDKGLILVQHTAKEKILALIEKLQPVKTDKELIRLGPKGDGGYLIPNDLGNIEACFSPGVDQISDFELDCSKHGMKLYLADKSVDRPNLDISTNYSFLKKFIGFTNNSDYVTLDEWVHSSDISSDSDLLLQMDIEGSEYFSLINISDQLLNRFRIIVIEFHYLQNLWEPNFYDLAQAAFNKILQSHTCVHIHPNNCSGVENSLQIEIPRTAEFTFYRNDRINFREPVRNFPHVLDSDNCAKEHITLPKVWYMTGS